jgi:hypothetical protein
MSATWSRSSRAPPVCRGSLPQRSVIVGVGPPSTSAEFRAGRLAAVEPEPTRSRPEVVPFRVLRTWLSASQEK